jgi:hypothetical protein
MLLGFVWWLLLTPGFLGPVMIVAATARAAWVGLIPTPLKRASTGNVDEL